MAYIGNQPYQGTVTGDNIVDGTIKENDLANPLDLSSKTLTLPAGVALPSQTGHSGKYLTTDGSSASWGVVVTGVRVSSITYPGNDTAVSPAGGQTITLTGSGFAATPAVFINGTVAPSVSFVSSTSITVVTPAMSAGTYHVYVVNPDGGTAIFVNGISYSGVPTWTTASGSLGTFDATFSIQLVATSDSAVTYALTTGSTLPAGITLSSGGLISGTNNTEQTFSFSVDAIDAQNQETPRSFSVTISLADPYFNRNVLLLSGNGANNQTNNTFLDSSANNFSITRNGNTTQGTFSPFSPTGWSNYFDGTGDFLSTPGNVSAFDFTATKTLTFECWAYFTGFPDNAAVFDIAESVPFRIICNAGGISWQATAAATTIVSGSFVIPLNTWNHIACVRDVDTVSIYMNGNRMATSTYSSNWVTSGATAYVGCNRGNTWFVQGHMSNVRLVKGSALYSGATYTVPTSPLSAVANTSLLTCQSNRFRDASTNNLTITRNGDVSVQAFSPFNPTAAWSASTNGGSGYFDGSGDYLTAPDNAAFDLGAGAFTLECFAYLNARAGSYDTLIAQWNNSSDSWLLILSGNTIQFYGNGALAKSESVTITTGQWYHFACTRDSSNNLRLYANGVKLGSDTAYSTTLINSTASPSIGCRGDGLSTTNFNGYLSSVRVIKGSAEYTGSTYTVPTAPLTAITNTSLLTNFTNAGIYDATSKNDLETVGNAQISTTQSKFGGSSMAFDGSGDRLYKPAIGDPLTDLGAGGEPFTVEQWVYFTTLSGQFLFSVGKGGGTAGWNSSSGHQYLLGIMSGGSLYLQSWSGSGISSVSVANPFSTGQWIHYAVSCDGTTTKVFVNGSQVISAAVAYARITNPSRFVVGDTPAYDAPFSGYIQDLRITKGYARYTANFTPPTTAHKLR